MVKDINLQIQGMLWAPNIKKIKQNKNNDASHIKRKLLKTKDKGNNIG